MNGIYIEDQEGMYIAYILYVWRPVFGNSIIAENDTAYATIHADYKTEANRDRAWQMLRNAISTGLRYFMFPTDAEVEKGEDE